MSTALASEIERLIRSSRLPELRDHLAGFRPPEIASALLDLRPGDQVIAFRVLPRKLAAAVSLDGRSREVTAECPRNAMLLVAKGEF